MANNDFLEEQRRAIERMNQMYLNSQIKAGGYKMPPVPPFVKLNKTDATNDQIPINETKDDIKEKSDTKHLNMQHKNPTLNGGFRLPFLNIGGFDKDISLILGLILILANEKADRRLLLALLYILM